MNWKFCSYSWSQNLKLHQEVLWLLKYMLPLSVKLIRFDNCMQAIFFDNPGKHYIDQKLAEIKAEVDGSHSNNEGGELLKFMLANEKLSMDDVYVNVTEILLSGVDTVSLLACVNIPYDITSFVCQMRRMNIDIEYIHTLDLH